jgi:endoglucanase
MNQRYDRRDFLKLTGASAVSVVSGVSVTAAGIHGAYAAPSSQDTPAQTTIPRWRGFNLLNFFQALSRGERRDGTIRPDDCHMISDLGFNFIRIPMDYWLWVDSDWEKTGTLRPDDVFKIRESVMTQVDRTVELGRKYGLHVNLNFHRAPGYCINNREREPFILWQDAQAEEAFVFHWDTFAKRYKGIPGSDLSFNLVNEAPRVQEGYMSRQDYIRIMTRATQTIRAANPERPVFVDGLSVGSHVVDELIPLGVIQSCRAYNPARISHYRASWVDKNMDFPDPSWPLLKTDGSVSLDRAGLERFYAPWADLARKGVGVHCGEGGCYNRTPHPVYLAWFTDVMDILKEHGIGYSLWEFRGSFGMLDSGRKDVDYEDWHGHKLDRKLLNLLQKH